MHNTSTRSWRSAALILALLFTGSFLVYGQEKAPAEPPPNARISPPHAGTAVLTTYTPLQPSTSVEATALAIAYHASQVSGAKATPEAIGKFAAEMLNAFSAARK